MYNINGNGFRSAQDTEGLLVICWKLANLKVYSGARGEDQGRMTVVI